MLRRALPAGLFDAGLASLATFAVGVYAARALPPADLGAYGVFFAAFLLAAVVPTHLMFTPAEIDALDRRPRERLGLVRHSLRVGGPVAVASAAIAVGAAALVVSGASEAHLLPLGLTAAACAVLSPIQDHVRRLFHLAGLSWRATATSAVQVGGVLVGLAGLSAAGASPLWLPFGALSAANVLSLLAGGALAWLGGPPPRTPAPTQRALARAGGWLLVSGVAPALGVMTASGLMARLADLAAVGHAEAARVVSQPVYILAVGFGAVLVPHAMEAGAAADPGRGARLARVHALLLLACGALYAGFTSWAWWGNPFDEAVPTAYAVPGLVTFSVMANLLMGLYLPTRGELLGARQQRQVAFVSMASMLPQVLVGFAAAVLGAFTRPLGVALYGAFVLLCVISLRRRRYRSGEGTPGPDRSTSRTTPQSTQSVPRSTPVTSTLAVQQTPPGSPGASPVPSRARPRVLVVSYACNPARGSEPGAAWGTVMELTRWVDVVVLTSSRHIADVRAFQSANAGTPASFVEVPEAPWTDGIQRLAARAHRQLWFVAYLAWLRRARQVAKVLHAEQPVDAAMHVAYGSFWLPSFVGELGVPAIWGPVGGATTTPMRLWPFLGWRGVVGELEKRLAIRLASLLPPTRRTWARADVVVTETATTRDRLPRRMRDGAYLVQRAVLSAVPRLPPVPREDFLLFAYALQGRKGPRLALRALAAGPAHLRLVFVTEGYEQRALERLARRLGVAERVEFRGQIPRDEMFDLMNRAAAVLFTGLREEGGCTLAEAMLLGAPGVVLGHGGARMIAEFGTDHERMVVVEPGRPAETVARMAEGIRRVTAAPPRRTGGYLDLSETRAQLHAAVSAAVPTLVGAPAPDAHTSRRPA